MNGKELNEFIRNHTKEEIRAEASKIKCTMCGKAFDEWDLLLGDNRYDIFINYPSKHDLERIQFNFCCDCFDRVLDTVILMCKNNPVVDKDWSEHCLINKGNQWVIDESLGPGGYEKKK